MGGIGSTLKKYIPRLMNDAGSGCASQLATLLDKRGPAWCKANRAYIVNELQARARQRKITWDRVAAAELVDLVIRTWELKT